MSIDHAHLWTFSMFTYEHSQCSHMIHVYDHIHTSHMNIINVHIWFTLMLTYDSCIWSYKNIRHVHMWTLRMFICEHGPCSHMIKQDDHIETAYDHIRTFFGNVFFRFARIWCSYVSMQAYELTYEHVSQWDVPGIKC